ncbi:MAG TPA: ABC transporter ATP-binding protein [Vulgatibacter sp.]|nr:ABC transporter ATP-binding protein [Vulgatibacter sp.]
MEPIRAVGLRKTYGSGNTEVTALRGVSLSVREGEVVALLGPSGSGKSTLLTALGLLNLPDEGDISIAGEPVIRGGRATRDLAAVRRRRLGFVFQKSNLIPFLTAIENVRLGLEINDLRGAGARRRAAELLEYLGIDDRMGNYPEQLSGGQQQRVAIARALAVDPPVLLADEPTAALDGSRSRSVIQLFRRIANERGTAVVVVTHDHRLLDAFDTLYEMEDGALREVPHRPPARDEIPW